MTNKQLRQIGEGKHRATLVWNSELFGTRTTDHKKSRLTKKVRNKIKEAFKCPMKY